MGIWGRGLRSLWAHKLQTVTLFVLAFAAAFQLYPGISMLSGIRHTKSTWASDLMTEVNVSPIPLKYDENNAPLMGGFTAPLTADMLRQLAAIPCVASYNAVTYRGAFSDGYQYTFQEEPGQADTYDRNIQLNCPGTTYKAPSAALVSATDVSRLGQFVYGGYQVRGRLPNAADTGKPVVAISRSLALEANLDVGDRLPLSGCYAGQKDISFVIVGIFDPNTELNWESSLPVMNVPFNPVNPDYIFDASLCQPDRQMYVPFGIVDNAWWNSVWHEGDAQEAYFKLKDPSDIGAFEAAAKKIPGMNVFEMLTHEKLYGFVIDPLDGTASRIARLMLAGGCFCLALFCLTVWVSLRGRRYELRTLLTIGQNTFQILAKLGVEMLIPVLAAFLAAGLFPINPLFPYYAADYSNRAISMLSHVNSQGIMPARFELEVNMIGKYYPDAMVKPAGSIAPAVEPGMLVEYAAAGALMVLAADCMASVLLLLRGHLYRQPASSGVNLYGK